MTSLPPSPTLGLAPTLAQLEYHASSLQTARPVSPTEEVQRACNGACSVGIWTDSRQTTGLAGPNRASDISILAKFARKNPAKWALFYWLFLGEVSPRKLPWNRRGGGTWNFKWWGWSNGAKSQDPKKSLGLPAKPKKIPGPKINPQKIPCRFLQTIV